MYDLKSRTIKTITLTYCSVGSLGSIKSIEDWRINELYELWVKFDFAFQNFNKIELNSLAKLNGYYPLYKQGILFCLQPVKGEALGVFLDHIKCFPNKVVFIDDKIEHLKSVQAD